MANNNAGRINCSNVIDLCDLKRYLKKFNDGVSLSIEQMDYVYNKLRNAASKMSDKEHVQNIMQTQKEIDNNICPRCGGALVLRKGTKGNFYGCSNYPRYKFTKKL